MTVSIQYRCGHTVEWPSRPPSEVLAYLEKGICPPCYRAKHPALANAIESMAAAMVASICPDCDGTGQDNLAQYSIDDTPIVCATCCGAGVCK